MEKEGRFYRSFTFTFTPSDGVIVVAPLSLFSDRAVERNNWNFLDLSLRRQLQRLINYGSNVVCGGSKGI